MIKYVSSFSELDRESTDLQLSYSFGIHKSLDQGSMLYKYLEGADFLVLVTSQPGAAYYYARAREDDVSKIQSFVYLFCINGRGV